MHKAINNANDGITIFKDGKVFTHARKATQLGGDVGVNLLPEYEHLIPDIISSSNCPKHWVFLHYCAFSGVYLGAFAECPEIDDVFEDTIAVDTFDFRWGMVPDAFKTFEGYRSMESTAVAAWNVIEVKRGED